LQFENEKSNPKPRRKKCFGSNFYRIRFW